MGVFDSGIGGLSVLAECVRLMPSVNFYYLGDNERAPYGNLSEEVLLRYAREAADTFRGLGVNACVLACNTVTAVCAEALRGEYSFPIVGCEPAVSLAAKRCKRALVLATVRTAESERLKRLTSSFPECEFVAAGLPDLAGAVERHFLYGERIDFSRHLPRGDYDGVVLGCTHYSLVKEQISDYYRLPVFDGAKGVARRLGSVLGMSECKKLGTADHLVTTAESEKISLKLTENNISFLKNDRNFNKSVFIRTFVSKI